MALLRFDKFIKQIFTDKRAVMVNLGNIEKNKSSGQWLFTTNELGKRLYLFTSMTFKNLKEASYYLEKSHKRINGNEEKRS